MRVMPADDNEPRSPLELLEALAVEEVEITPDLVHVETYTMRGLLTLIWHGPRDARHVVVTCGGGMGSMLGPSHGLYHWLGTELAPHGIGTIRVGYRKPNDLSRCMHDVTAACDLASRSGARRFVAIGHSFGGAVAIQAGVVLGEHCAGVIGLATQSAGCEIAGELGDTPLLLLHGTDDEILPPETSGVVQILAGHGDVVLLPGTGHLLTQSSDEVRDRVRGFVLANLLSEPTS
jgi:pimeloyl-ACP methyl ester carboxylesterase